MASCTFFGDNDLPKHTNKKVNEQLTKLIKQGVDVFYVGHQNEFDIIVLFELQKLKKKYPYIRYAHLRPMFYKNGEPVYINNEGDAYNEVHGIKQMYIVMSRNEWMFNHSDYIVLYVKDKGLRQVLYKNIEKHPEKAIIDMEKL